MRLSLFQERLMQHIKLLDRFIPEKHRPKEEVFTDKGKLKRAFYDEELRKLQIELVKLQNHIREAGLRVVILFEGIDTAGKDGTISRIIEHMNPRHLRVVALGKPSPDEESSWYFQRYIPHLPCGGEIVLFNRSWYNRAGVERVMGFCSHEAYLRFVRQCPRFEEMLVDDGILLFKYWLDIDKHEQARRLKERRSDPLKQWKLSAVDKAAHDHYNDYVAARDDMFLATHSAAAPWIFVNANDKKRARLNIIRDILRNIEYQDKDDQSISLASDDEILSLAKK